MHASYCCCVVFLGSVAASTGEGVLTLSDTTRKSGRQFFPASSSHRDPNRALTVVAPSTPRPPSEEVPSIPETPKFDPEGGGEP